MALPSWRKLAALVAVLLQSPVPANAELTGVKFRGYGVNIPVEVAHVIQRGEGSIGETCDMDPPEFVAELSTYVFKCAHTAHAVDIILQGENNYLQDSGGGLSSTDTVGVDLPEYEEPVLRRVVSCPPGTSDPKDSSCTTYTFDIFRRGGDMATLAILGISSPQVLLALSPNFKPSVLLYEANVSLGIPFSITARSAEPKTRVGIAYEGPGDDSESGLGPHNGCHLGTQQNMVWNIPAFKTAGSGKVVFHNYVICAIAPDQRHMLKYKLKITVMPNYSELLKSIKASPYPMVEKFDPHHSMYSVYIPEEHSREQAEVDFSVETNDTEAEIEFQINGKNAGQAKRGKNTVTVKMDDNTVLKESETPQWSKALDILVKSADKSKTRSYTVKVTQNVSSFCKLKNLTVGTTPCKLIPIKSGPGVFYGPEDHPNITGFNPDHNMYKCIFDWADSEFGEILAIKDEKDCKHCELKVPDPRENKKKHLSLRFQTLRKIPYVDVAQHVKDMGWKRDFLYGEYHTVPIQVISANRYTDCIYNVYFERDAPWYMRVQTTRLMSNIATAIAISMSLSGPGSVMALAKQVQFLTLTIEIDGVPQVYKNFVHTFKSFNLDISSYLPDFGLPSKQDFDRYKEHQLKVIQTSSGVDNAKLLMQYCYAKGLFGQLAGNAILHAHPTDTAVLLKRAKEHPEQFGCQGSSKLCDKMKAEKKGKGEDAKKEDADDGAEAAEEVKTARRLAWESARDLLGRGANGSRPMLRGNIYSLVTGVEYDADPDVQDKGFLYRRLDDDDDEEEDEEKDEEEYADVWNWLDGKWKKFIDKQKKAGVKKDTYPDILPCNGPFIGEVKDALLLMHKLAQLREMLQSTTGSFVLFVLGLISFGSVYLLYYFFVMKGTQKRLKILEPAEFWIFVFDYGLIGFSKGAAELAFQDALVTLFVFTPTRTMTQIFCIVGILAYPLLFVVFVACSVCYLTGNLRKKEGEESHLVYNHKRGQWLDPRCNEIKVDVRPKIPRAIPLLPKVLTKHVRACVPILDIEGERLEFDDTKTAAAAALRKAKKKRQAMDEKAAMEKELQHMDSTIQSELETITSDHNEKHRKMKENKLKMEADMVRKNEEWNKKHAHALTNKVQKLRDRAAAPNADSRPPWFIIAATGEHEDPSAGGDDTQVDENYANIPLADMIEGWQSRKKRADHERVDKEEKFAISQYIENHIRDEKKYLKYNVMTVSASNGFLKPKEPIHETRTVTCTEGDAGILYKPRPQGTPLQILEVEDGKWADRQHLKAGTEVIELNGSSPLYMNEEQVRTEMAKSSISFLLREGSLEGDDHERLWLPKKSDYLRDDLMDHGHHPWLEEYAPGAAFFENEEGERLVYTGNQRSALGWTVTGWGVPAGRLKWMSEPDDGWELWEQKNLKERGATSSTVRYADKWQWVMYDNFDSPWDGDDAAEDEVTCCCCCKFQKSAIPFFNDIKRLLQVHFQDRVPQAVSPREKIEIRKWLWGNLKNYMELKLKISFLADKHPKFFQEKTLDEVANNMTFHQVMFSIETAKPNAEWMRDFGGGAKYAAKPNRGTTSMDLSVAPDGSAQNLQLNQHELLEFTVMKLEDMYPFEGEPWWAEAEERAADRGEIKVMFNHNAFWMTSADEELGKLRKDNDLVPHHGYCTSTCFRDHPDEVWGSKMYNIQKPDQTVTKIKAGIQLGHVLPLMKYTKNFKVDVPLGSLDLPHRSSWQIVIGDKKKGEELNYCVDRFTTLTSIIALSFKPKLNGLVTVAYFTAMKTVTLFNTICTSVAATRAERALEEAQEAEAADAEQFEEANESQSQRDERQPLIATQTAITPGPKPATSKSPTMGSDVRNACKQAQVRTTFLQICTLLTLGWGQDMIPSGTRMQTGLCAFTVIVIASLTMILMNMELFASDIQAVVESWTQYAKDMNVFLRNRWTQTKEFLGGENPLGIQIIEVDQDESDMVLKAEKISVVVPDLGITYDGEPEIPKGMPLDEQRKMELSKKICYFTLQRDNDEDTRPRSIRDTVRYEKDVEQSLAVALSIDQMMLCAKIPQVVATIQCLNHNGSNLSRPAYDNYLTLFKPEDWEPEFEADEEKVTKVLNGWSKQVNLWLTERLGAVQSERTCTRRIQEQIYSVLKKECTGSVHRELVKVKVNQLWLPEGGSVDCKQLIGKLGYVSWIYENEKVKKDFPPMRMTRCAKFEQYKYEKPPEPEKKEEEAGRASDALPPPPERRHENLRIRLPVNSELLMEIPTGVTKARLAVWVQLQDLDSGEPKEEELVAFSSEISVVQLSDSYNAGEPLQFFLHSKWKHASGHGLDPFGGEDEDEEEKDRKRKMKEELEMGKSSLQRCLDKVKGSLLYVLTCKCCRRPPTDEEILVSKGVAEIQVQPANQEERDADAHMLLAMKDVIGGDSAMNHSKLERHKDRYVDIADFFGIFLRESDIQDLRNHRTSMKEVHDEMWTPAERGKSEQAKKDGLAKREKKVFDRKIRRHLEDFEEMEFALEHLDEGITKNADKHKFYSENGMKPVPAYMVAKRRVSGRVVYSGDRDRLKEAAEAPERLVSSVMLDSMIKYRLREVRSSKSVLHYVVISDHIKPGRNWRPDSITPHVAHIVTNEVEDVPEVKLVGLQQRLGGSTNEVLFKRELKEKSKDPHMVNSRLCFKAEGQVYKGVTDPVFLYWDGSSRWVVSPHCGAPAPYGLRKQGSYGEQFMWCKDGAVSPDKATGCWMVWNPKPGADSVWEKEKGISVVSSRHGQTVKADRLNQNMGHLAAEDPEAEGEGGMLNMVKVAFGEIFSVFSTGSSRKLEPALRDCLISMDAKYLNITMKDSQVPKLAPFRKFLLNEFGTYQCAWLYITRNIKMARTLGTQNLAKIFQSCLDEIAMDDFEEKKFQDEEVARTNQKTGLEEDQPPDASEATTKTPESKKKKKPKSPKEKKGKKGEEPEEQSQQLQTQPSTFIRRSSFHEGTKEPLRTFICRVRHFDEKGKKADKKKKKPAKTAKGVTSSGEQVELTAEPDLEMLAAHIMNSMDKEGDGDIKVQEVHGCYEDNIQDPLLKEFAEWLQYHPKYRDIEYLWERLSEDLEITLPEFQEATKRLMLKFRTVKEDDSEDEGGEGQPKPEADQPRERPQERPEDKAAQIFAILDAANMSGGISYQELRPFSGDRWEDAEESLLKMHIPLTHLKEVNARGRTKKLADDKQIMRFEVNHQFENAKPWRNFRLSMDPDWEPRPHHEFVDIAMLPNYYKLWNQVVMECEMIHPQEWVRYYTGEYQEHPHISGSYMRHGEGTQRWANGMVFTGHWRNHLYDGPGKLWGNIDDLQTGRRPPIYDGQWERGKQHGEGVMRYEQDIHDRRGQAAATRGQHAGITKIYLGQFKDGLYHGRGQLKMDKAVAQQLPGRSKSSLEARPGFVPLPQLDPAHILSFEGTFGADWFDTDKRVREWDPLYNRKHPLIKYKTTYDGEEQEHMDLKLEDIRKHEKRTARFQRYFAEDANRVQKAGPPPPNLAMAAYQLRGGDGLHMKQSKMCRYADGTEYVGQMLDGYPDGEGDEENKVAGVTTQYEVLDNGEQGEQLAKYEGQWLAGERSREGKYETADGLVYEGQWKSNKRHGKGEQKIDEALRESLGYESYVGEWENDLKHGEGKLFFGEEGCLMYQGEFSQNLREGNGAIYMMNTEEKETNRKSVPEEGKEGDTQGVKIFVGRFVGDVPHSTPSEPMWTHLVMHGHTRGRFFYGQLDADGQRVGIGTLYDEDADEDTTFMECYNNNRPYIGEDPKDVESLKYITYHGPFKDNLPEGEGIQHFRSGERKAQGVYQGQFQNGMRHGRGVWTSKDKAWKYRPVRQSEVPNWEKDLMHGIAIVEDKQHVHENVIYNRGRCQMPFTDMGPPLTGFDNTVLMGSVVRAARKGARVATGKRVSKAAPAASIAKAKQRGGVFSVFKTEDHEEGWNNEETMPLQSMGNSGSKRETTNGDMSMSAPRSRQEMEEDTLAMVREETDLNLPEEDVMVKGGTDTNGILNGLYFKMNSTYGLPIYKMVKREGVLGKVVQRYLFKDDKTGCWVIAPKPRSGILSGPGCAYALDPDADRPGLISNNWYTWYPSTKSMRLYGEEPEDEAAKERAAKMPPIDQIRAVSVVGFEITGLARGLLRGGLLLRHGRELYGRPVYEAENGGQFLYWMQANGSLENGMLDEDELETADINDPGALFSYNGSWIVAKDVGEVKGGPLCLAYIDDIAVTPDLINPRSYWYVATNQSDSGEYEYESSSTMRLVAEEWTRNTDLLATFDEEEAGAPPDGGTPKGGSTPKGGAKPKGK